MVKTAPVSGDDLRAPAVRAGAPPAGGRGGRDRARGGDGAPAGARRRPGRARRGADEPSVPGGGTFTDTRARAGARDDEPRLADGTALSAHQADALSGTLIALLAERRGRAKTARPRARRGATLGAVELEGDDEATRSPWTGTRSRRRGWKAAEVREDPGASRRLWFERATGAGKTVAGVGFAEPPAQAAC